VHFHSKKIHKSFKIKTHGDLLGPPLVFVQAPPLHKRHYHAIKIVDFHDEESPHYQNNAFNKAIARHNQLRPNLEFLP
jgi:hypothetical protein